jgi:hypothetical protein
MITIAPTHYTQKTELLRKNININDQGSNKSAGKKKKKKHPIDGNTQKR